MPRDPAAAAENQSPGLGAPGIAPKITVSEKRLTVILATDEGQYCAYCPELDLVAETPTPEEALQDIMEAMEEYAEEYLAELDLYNKSPNRSHHLPYVRAIAECRDTWDLRMLIEILHGRVHVRASQRH